MSQQQAKKLLRKYLNGTATAAERQLVESWYEFRMEDGQLLLTPEEEREILERVRLKALAATPVVSLYRRKIFWRTAAAVCLVLLAGGAVFYWQREKVSTTVVARDDRRPGSNGAVLTLANGQQILLDSSTNGQVAQQGNMQLVKLNGQLSYQAANGAAITGWNTLTTPRARQFRIVLPDGSVVMLNAGSSLRFPVNFSAKERRITLQGEAYFEVAHNAAKPFIASVLKSGRTAGEVQVLGTHFNINSYADEDGIKATLLEGKVRYSKDKRQVLLQPGQQAVAMGKTVAVRQVDVEDIVAWTQGKLALSHTSVPVIMRQLSRWYDVDIRYTGAVPDIKFSGIINRNVSLQTMLHVLEVYGVHTRFDGKTVAVD